MKHTSHKPYINNAIIVLLMVLVVSVGLMMSSIWYISLQDDKDKRYVEYTDALKVSIQVMREQANELLHGNFTQVDALYKNRMLFAHNYHELLNDYKHMRINEPPITRFPETAQLSQQWQKTQRSVDVFLAHQKQLMDLYHIAQKTQGILQACKKDYKKIVDVLLKSGAPADQVLAANQQAWLLEEMLRFVDHEVHGTAAEDLQHPLTDSPRIFYQRLNAALNASEGMVSVNETSVMAMLQGIKTQFDTHKVAIDKTFNNTDALIHFYQWTGDIIDGSYRVFSAIGHLQTAFNTDAAKRRITVQTATWFGVLAVGIIILIGSLLVWYARQQLKESKAKHLSDQRSVAQLTERLMRIGQGDLTIVAPVMTDITHDIAQAINVSTGHLRRLVSTIASASGKVDTCTAGSQRIAEDLKTNNWHQVHHMKVTSETIATMIQSIERVFEETRQAKEVAEETVQTASFGNTIVKNSVHSMEHIGQQIQSTSNQIKKLGESSQEISELMTLIHELAEKTHVIALNAAIQANSHHDNEQSISMVANEVRHLADQSSAATHQVEQWVKRLQQDTQAAMIAMAGTTSEAAKGIQLINQAGDALDSIESISHDLAHMIEEIARITSDQSQSVGHLSGTLESLQNSTQDISRVTQANTDSIERLLYMAGMMKQSVADFTLPQTDLDDASENR